MSVAVAQKSNPIWQQYRSLFALLKVLKDHRLMFWTTTLLGIFNQLCSIAVAGVSALIVGLVATGSDWAAIATPVWTLLGLVLAVAVLAWLEMWLVHDMAYRVLASLRLFLFHALERLAPAYFADRRVGDLTSAAMADVETLEWFYAHTVGTVIVVFTVSGTVLGVLGFLHPSIALWLTPLLLAQAIVPSVFAHKAARQGETMRRKLSDVNADTIEAVQGLRDLAIFDTQDRYLNRLNQQSEALIQSQVQHGMRDGLEHALTSVISGVGFLSVLILAANLVANGELDPAHYPVVTILAGAVFLPVITLSRIAANLGNMGAAAERVQTILTAEPTVKTDDDLPPVNNLRASLEFDRVTFSYPGNDHPALRDVSFRISPGETVALVGHSGAGKSTCAHLATRFWDVDSGTVSIDGQDLRQLNSSDINRHITLLSQVTHLFNTSLRENIRIARPGASDNDVTAAAEKATAHEFIETLPQAYETSPGDRGLQLSGGQRQRIALSRAFLADAPILILDESMAHLDSESEKLLQQSLDRHRGSHQATLVIAHRLSTIRACDRILVLHEGALVESGSHEQLIEANGFYAGLVQAQQDGAIAMQASGERT
jgi:thiol reductant ABC exporter CydC subunit